MIKVLNKGYIHLVEHMGGDASIIESARRCWRSTSKGEESDRKLIRHLLQKGHKTPFESMTFRFDVKCPLFVARQWVRHRIAGLCEESLRYCVAEKEYYVPKNLSTAMRVSWQEHHERQFDAYEEYVQSGIPKEQARSVLPIGIYTKFYWFINGSSLLNFVELRMDPHAQKEIREYANAILWYIEDVAPITMEEWKKLRQIPHG